MTQLLLAVAKTDRPDGLYSTLVVDSRERALGFVYSSFESVKAAIDSGTGVYQSRERGLWFKGASSGATQDLLSIGIDCDGDCLKFQVIQKGSGFCHLNTPTCFGPTEFSGLSALESTLKSRMENAPEGSYTKRLFTDSKLLSAKILEEAEELVDAKSKEEVSWEAADLFYFALARIVKDGLSLSDIERNLDLKALKVSRRTGNAKPKYQEAVEAKELKTKADTTPATSPPVDLVMQRYSSTSSDLDTVLQRPAQKSADIMKLVKPIVESVKTRGDAALLEYTKMFDKVELESCVISAPFPEELMKLDAKVKEAIDLSIENVRKFHAAQLQSTTVSVETAPGVICSRFARPIESVGLYIPGGTAVLPSTALMLGVPAQVAGCEEIVFASPPRKDGSITPEVVYVAHKVGAKCIVLAGGAQAVAAMAYGTESVPKTNKIMGPGNQFVTAAKMYVSNDTSAAIAIDMPAGPSEVLVIADSTCNPAFVAADLLSQAEHGVDSQVILIALALTEEELLAIEDEVKKQALALPRVDIVRGSIAHSITLTVETVTEAFELSNRYAPEHLILHIEKASERLDLVKNAGSVFVGQWSPESCGDYSSGTNHTLPTYGYAKMYSGVNTGTYLKHITSQELTEEGLKNIGPAVMSLASVEGLDAHGRAVGIRLASLN
ncbi:hypothetical protein CANCADRAFT_28128 [Tortispora caseinolytica NRRL Y-17796]|uniref:Histidine biosynthesis trifunctional protein n=1 Tax=Tortispora caseinolytica NRRL Y-17796 TaxID=767744 RepID=A0A1E4TAW2_9ASCO|nr:hypothetical protein CANCADRAFT_28128 [Tortispora caseinolytica NRRL Y-17796]